MGNMDFYYLSTTSQSQKLKKQSSKENKDYKIKNKTYDYSKSLTFKKSEEYIHKFLTDYSQDPPIINQEA